MELMILRKKNQLPAPLGHRPLQHALRLLHAGRGGCASSLTARSSATRSCCSIAAAAVAVGIEKIRITGGEPLVRKGIVRFWHGWPPFPACGSSS